MGMGVLAALAVGDGVSVGASVGVGLAVTRGVRVGVGTNVDVGVTVGVGVSVGLSDLVKESGISHQPAGVPRALSAACIDAAASSVTQFFQMPLFFIQHTTASSALALGCKYCHRYMGL